MNETRGQKNTGSRKAAILETVATMLEKAPGDKITIAKIAADVGVSEAAIYRHFASKAIINNKKGWTNGSRTSDKVFERTKNITQFLTIYPG